MARVFYHGAYKAPREFNWVIGVVLLTLTLLLSFTGYLLPWDQLALWAVTVGTNMMGYTPVFGTSVKYVLLGSKEISNETLLRWYVLHVLLLPFVIVIFMAVHFWRVRKDGGISGSAVGGGADDDRDPRTPPPAQQGAPQGARPPRARGGRAARPRPPAAEATCRGSRGDGRGPRGGAGCCRRGARADGRRRAPRAVAQIPAHLLERVATDARRSGSAAGGGGAPAPTCPPPPAPARAATATATLPAPTVTGPGGHTQRLLTVVKSGSIQQTRAEAQDKVHTWPHLLVVEFAALLIVTAALTIFSALVRAPLLGSPTSTRRRTRRRRRGTSSGLQELLTMFHPMVAGVTIPGMGLFLLMVAPFVDKNPSNKPKDRKFAIRSSRCS